MAKGMCFRLVCLAALLVNAVGQTIRLVSPLNNGVGRLEVYYNGSWGTVCDDDFEDVNAIVACRQLGRYETGMKPKYIHEFGFGSGTIWLDELECNGTESSLSDCPHYGWGDHNCEHYEDVGIICDENEVTIKLTHNYYNKGLLQVYHNGTWGTVCDDRFGQVEASVVCRGLGYQAGMVYHINTTIPMILDDVRCTMLNTDLKDCKHGQWGSDNCSSSEAVGVECFSFTSESTAARLVSTTNTPGKGVLELYYEGQWGQVCSTGFGVEEAMVACRLLGHNTIGASSTSHTKTSTPPVILDKVQCLGTELSFNECLHYPWEEVDCSTVAGIRCPSAYSQIRLNSTIPGRGRVEVLHNNVWGTVCSGSSFSTQEAQVVCKMVNLPWTSANVTNSYGPGEGLVWLSNVNCTGTETSLDECSHSGWGTASCSHSSDVGVVCSGATLQIHLEPSGSVLNVILGQVISVVCVVDSSNSPVTSFRWTHNGSAYSGQTFNKTVTSKSDSGTLECSVGNVRASTQISVLYRPVIHLEPSNDTIDVIVGEDLLVDCVVDDANPSVHIFRWSHNGQTSTGSTFLKRNIARSDRGTLTCTADNGHMMTPGRADAHVNVLSTLQIHLEPSGSVLNVLLGQVISVVCVVDSFNSPVTSFRWTHNGSAYSGQTFNKTVTSKSDSGTLECSVGNVLASTQISVLYRPVIHLEPSNDTIDVIVGEDLLVDCVVDDANPSVHTFRWSHNGQTSTGSTFLKRNIARSDRGALTCTADNGHMMTPGRADAHVNVLSTLQIHLEPSGSVLNVLLGQVISVVCVVDSFNSPVTSFRWTHNGSAYSGQTFNKTVTSKSDSGTLECSVGNVLASTQISVLYRPVIHLEPSNDTIDVIVGEDLLVDCVVDDANPSVHTFRWSHNGQTSTGSTFLKRNIARSDRGALTCTADNGHMMTPGRADAHVNVLYPPVVHLEPSNDTLDVTVGDDLLVDCVVDDANPSVHTFRWSHNGQTSTGSTFLKRNIIHSDGGKLTCTADNGHMMTPGQAVAHVNVRWSDDTEEKKHLTAIVTGYVGIVVIIILIVVIIHLRRTLHAEKLGHEPNKRPNRARRSEHQRQQQVGHSTIELYDKGSYRR